jgi:diguanylate cyclase (GGDEF)-like protein
MDVLLDPAYEIEGCYMMSRSEAMQRLPQNLAVYSSVQNGAGPWAWEGHWLMVPLYDTHGTVTGVIWADEPEDRLLPDRPFLQTLRVFANQATAALDSAARFEEMRFLAEHDPLTRLLNRRAFTRRLEVAIEDSVRHGAPFGLVLCDLDELKTINDQDGHPAGDAALVRVAAELSNAVRQSDTVFRIGGDEFALLLPESDTAAVARVIERASAGLRGGLDTGSPLRASLGGSVYPDDGRTADTVFRAADSAMYGNKRDGRRGRGRAA